MDWFEAVGFERDSAEGDDSYYQNVAGNDVGLYYYDDESDQHHSRKWYCCVTGNNMNAYEFADTKEDAFLGAMRKFKDCLVEQRSIIDTVINEIDNAITLAINNKGARQ